MLKLHYPSDVTDFIVGQVMGPDLHKAYYVVRSAYFQDGKTTAFLRPLGPGEFRTCVIDQTGFLRLPTAIFGPGAE